MEQINAEPPIAPVQQGNPKKRLMIVGVLIVLLAGLGMLILGSGSKPKTPLASPSPTRTLRSLNVKPSPTLMPHPSAGSFTLTTQDGRTRYPVDSQIKLILTADSGGTRVVGYDAVLKYTLAGFAYSKTTSLIPDYQVYAKDAGTYISASGVQALTSSVSGVFTNTPLLQFEFTAARKGTYTFFLMQKGSETNKMVDDKAQTTYPQTGKLQLEIY